MPRTRPGRLALGGDVVAMVAFGAFAGLVASGQRGGDEFFSNPWLAWTIIAAFGSAILAGAIGLFGMVRRRERSPLVAGSVALGILAAVWVALEIAFPH
jgi:hypothetical protein